MVNSQNKISTILDEDLQKAGDKGFALTRNRLVGKNVVSYGVRTSEIRKIVKKYRKEFQELKRARDCFEIASDLISRKVLDDQIAGIFLLGLCKELSQINNIARIEKLIVNYIDNWAVCDTISSKVVTRILEDLPEEIEILYSWVQSENKWLRRAALVTAVKLKNKISNWEDVSFSLLSLSSKERDSLVKKARSWLTSALKR